MTPIASVEEGLQRIAAFDGQAKDFQLVVPDSLQDPLGLNMAILCDGILARDWQPDGFTPAAGYRVYRFKDLA